MVDQLAEQLLEVFKNTPLPESNEITEESRQIYMHAHDILLMYRGHPDTLLQAYQVFLATNVRAYVYAGMARIILMAGYISGGDYDADTVREGYRLLRDAQEFAPHQFEIDMIEPEVYNMLKQYKKMRACLDDIIMHPDADSHFRYAILELWYWEKREGREAERQIERWSNRAQELASTHIQKLYATNNLAGVYLDRVQYKKALELYQLVVKLDPGDPWAWHNMSIIYLRTDKRDKAFDCNRRALHIMEFGNALNVQESLVKFWSRKRHDDVIDEACPYITDEAPGDNGFLNKLFGKKTNS